MAQRDHATPQNVFESSSTRSQPRANSLAPVLFGLPNLQKGSRSESKSHPTPPTPPAATHENAIRNGNQSAFVTSNPSTQAAAKPTSAYQAILAKALGASSPNTSHSVESPSASTSSLSSQSNQQPVVRPSYQAIPESALATPREPRPFLSSWGSRLISLGVLALLIFVGWRSFPNVRRNIAEETLQKEGLADSDLQTDVEFTSNPMPSNPSVTRVAEAPTTQFNMVDANARANKPSKEISLEVPAQTEKNNSSLDNSDMQFSPPSDESFSGFRLGADESSSEKNPSTPSDTSEPNLSPPSFASRPSNDGSDWSSNLDASHSNTNVAYSPGATTNPNPNDPSPITETEFANLSIDELLAARQRMMIEQGLVQSPPTTPRFQTTSASSSQPTAQRTPLQGQAYPPQNATPNAVVVPNGGQVGPTIKPYQPIGPNSTQANNGMFYPSPNGLQPGNGNGLNPSTPNPSGYYQSPPPYPPALQPATNNQAFPPGYQPGSQPGLPQNYQPNPMNPGTSMNPNANMSAGSNFQPNPNGPPSNYAPANNPPQSNAAPANSGNYGARLNPDAILQNPPSASTPPTAQRVLPPYNPVGANPQLPGSGPLAPPPTPNR